MELIGLIPSFGNLLFTIAAFIAALSVIVAVHEYGHYIVGRWTGIHAEVFSLGFGPVLYSRRDRRGTVWQVAALPLGGYVKFLGDADAASSPDAGKVAAMPADLRRRTMAAAPLWARSATVAAGPAANFLLSIVVFAAIFVFQGRAVEPPTVGQLAALPPEATAGLLPGDRILAVGGIETPDFAALYAAVETLPPQPRIAYRLVRDGQEIETEGPWPFPPLAASVQPGSAAMDVGLRPGDLILAVEGRPVTGFADVQAAVRAAEGGTILVTVWRAGETLDFTLAPRRVDLPLPDGGFETRWLIGLTGGLAFEPATAGLGVPAALGAALDQVWFLIRASLSGLWHMVTGAISSCNLQGPIGIAETSGDMAAQGAQSFIWFIAVLSTAVGLLNLFPIPVLDGGHLVFHAWEAVTRRPPPEAAMRVLMGVGLALILTLMVFALSNDIFCP